MDAESIALVDRFRQGDQEAARLLFDRYVQDLIAVAHRRLSPRLARRVDAEDVVQSAFRSFFGRVQHGRFAFEESGDLWRLLVVITLNKVRSQAEFHGANKRRLNMEQSWRHDGLQPHHIELAAQHPAPHTALQLEEEIAFLTDGMDEVQKQMVLMRLHGYQLEEIGEELGRSERTVRRVMAKVRKRLEERCLQTQDTGGPGQEI